MRGIKLRAVPLAVSFALVSLTTVSSAHETGTWQNIADNILTATSGPAAGGCFSGCHGSSQNGGMGVSANNEDAWFEAMVNRGANNGSAASVGKLRVDPKRAWNSFLLDKLTGELKTGEADPMARLTPGYVFQCPGGVEKIRAWIVAGAPHGAYAPGQPYVPGDPSPGLVECGRDQPILAPPLAPSDGVQLIGTPFTLTRTAAAGGPRNGVQTTSVGLGNTSDSFITGVDITASAGTEYVTLSRAGEQTPIAVARGETLSLTLPAGVGVKIAPNEQLEIRQVIRNDYWAPLTATEYKNETTGSVFVNLHLATSVASEAAPFRDDTGSQALFVLPETVGATGGAWVPSGATGALVGIWSDRRALETILVDAASGAVSQGADVANGYEEVGAAAVPYACVHANGYVANLLAPNNANLSSVIGPVDFSAPLKWGCEESARIPPGMPAIAGGPASAFCTTSATSSFISGNDCAEVGTKKCVPANLVFGEGADDARCTLVGLKW